jgi:hypothetical protein
MTSVTKYTSHKKENIMSIKIVETERLVLQVPQQCDLNHLIALRTDPAVMKCTGGLGQPFGTELIHKIDHITLYLLLILRRSKLRSVTLLFIFTCL